MKEMKKVAVLLSTYNGDKYLNELIDSVLNQKGVIVDIYIRDDGSSDDTHNILESYELHNNIFIFREDNIGYAKSFWKLLSMVDEYDYYAFCDQDDIWLENKLFMAVNVIEHENCNKPILYTSRVVSVNNSMQILSENCFRSSGVINVYQSFQKSILPGCVFVFNEIAKKIMIKYKGYMESHDWATYCIISAFGKVVYDDNSYIRYRMHGNNAIGVGGRINELLKKVRRFFQPPKNTRSKFAADFLCTYGELLNDDMLTKQLYLFANYRSSFNCKINLLKSKYFRGFIFKLYIILNRG